VGKVNGGAKSLPDNNSDREYVTLPPSTPVPYPDKRRSLNGLRYGRSGPPERAGPPEGTK